MAGRRTVGKAGVRIGCAGWAIPGPQGASFPGEGSHLERYARVLPAVEINSSFYRSHRPRTYETWARSVPEGFRFSVKLLREITHFRRLVGVRPALARFLEETSALGEKRGPILVQLPPSLAFEEVRAGAFFEALRGRHEGDVVCEPRHAGWFTSVATRLLVSFRIARVAADPARVPAAARPGGWRRLAYFRLHGSPEMYVSPYPRAFLKSLAASLVSRARRAAVWCIFDNTAAGAATANALTLMRACAPKAR